MAETPNTAVMTLADNPNLVAYQSMLQAIPEVVEGSYEGLLLQLLNAKSVHDLDSPFKSDALAKFQDQYIIVTNVRRAPSDFAGGLGHFLIVDLVHEDSGEKFTVTTGSVMIVAQVARAVSLGALPFKCIPRVSAKPTKNGFYPQHLEITVDQPKTYEEAQRQADYENDESQPF